MLGEVAGALDPVARGLMALCLAAVLGLGLGAVRVRGVGLGIGGVLFAGIALGALGLRGDPDVMAFLKDFGLILFVYAIGNQVGPGFFATLKRAGLGLNLLAAAVVGLGVACALVVHWLGGLPVPVVLGLFSGAVTNTPSLAAGQQMLAQLGAPAADLTVPGLAYAVAYPFGIAGILIAMGVVRLVFRADPLAEAARFEAARRAGVVALETLNVRLTNPNLDGLPLAGIPGLCDSGVVVSRLRHAADGAQVEVPHPETPIRLGDVLLVVGPPERLRAIRLIVGEEADVNLKAIDTAVRWERFVVTRTEVLGKAVGALRLLDAHGVVVSRINRAGVELVPSAEVHLQFGDILTVIGPPPGLAAAAGVLGNNRKALQQAQVAPLFIGIALGVLLGSLPFTLPGLPVPVHLGLAGGPLLIALLLARLGHLGPLVWFMPPSANHLLREVGIVLFLAVVGLSAGPHVLAVLLSGEGLAWMAWGAGITLLPLLAVGLYARAVAGYDHLTTCGLLAGSMTDPPALAFANAAAPSEAPALAYASVYPLVMCLRILAPQVMALILWTT